MYLFRSIRSKLQAFSLMALLLVFATAGAAWWSIGRLAQATADITQVGSALQSQQEADMMHDAIRGDVLAMLLAVAKSDTAAAEAVVKDQQDHLAQFHAALDALHAMPLKPELLAAAKAVGPALKGYEEQSKKLMDIGMSGREPTKEELAAFQSVFGEVEEAMGSLSNLIESQGDVYLNAANDGTAFARYLMLGVVALATLLLLVVSTLAARGIAGPVGQALGVAEAVAQGDLTVQIKVTSVDETGQLLQALVKMRDSLSHTVSQVRSATDSINTASSEIASGNQDLSARTEQAASNLEETAASMEELTSTVSQSADAARQANQLAASASEVAVRGGQVVSQVVSTMEEINHSSKKISDIIGVIDGIAFQTNILALNAAVEAARAGEQGRGFAVVASEVRSLAQRSAEAAKEIKGLIGTSVDKVETGSRLVADAGQTMSEIVGSVQRVSDIIGEITSASSEQSNGIAQVNTAVSQLDQMTQQNAALVEQSAAAAESLKDQATRLAQVVQVFRLGNAKAIPLNRNAAAIEVEAVVVKASPMPKAIAQKKPSADTRKPATQAPSMALKRPASAPAAAARMAAPAAPIKAAAGGDEGDWESF
jgi:methyl-accepting chemotaxis protein